MSGAERGDMDIRASGQEGGMAPQSVLSAFIEHAVQQPQATALIWNGERITYGELHATATRIASQVRTLGLPLSQPVGILAKKSPRSIALIIGCLMTGHRFLLPSAELPGGVLRTMFERAGCSRILSPDVLPIGVLPEFAIEIIEDGTATAGQPRVSPEADDAAFMLTTSGSTGVPKAVPLPMPAIDRFTDWACASFDLQRGRTVLNYAPLNFDLCFLDIWATLKGGGCVALVDQDRATNAGYLCELLTSAEVHAIQAVPMLYRLLIDAALPKGRCFPSVRHVIFTGDSMPAACVNALPELFPAARLYNIYGCTETNDSFIHEVDRSTRLAGPVPIGQPLPGVDALIVDDEGATIEGAGMGELLVSTPFQTPGYLGADLNEGKFVVRGGMESARTYFRTGDLVRRQDDGSIMLEGRKDFHVKVRGVRVNIQHVERILLEHDDVLEGAIVTLPDPVAGHRLYAAVRRRPESGLNSLRLFQHCARRLERAAVPSTINVTDIALPRTPTGKIDRRQISRTYVKGEHHAV